MKKTVLFFIFFIMLYSCKKEDDGNLPGNPQWLTEKISVMETPDEYAGTTVFAYNWNKEYYYFIQVPLSNCGMCEFYDYKGIRFIWTDEKLTDFSQSAKMIQVIWHRDSK